MFNMDIFIVFLVFLIPNVLTETMGSLVKVENLNDSESLMLENPKLVSVHPVGELVEYVYSVGERAENDKLVSTNVGSKNYEVFQNCQLEFKYPDASNQNAKMTFVLIRFKTNSPYDPVDEGYLQPDMFNLLITFKRITHVEYNVNIYGN